MDFLVDGIERLRHQRSTDKLGRIEWTKTTVDEQTAVRRDYTYNAANQRMIVEHEDGRAWHYSYDGLGQVISAHKRLSADPQSAILPGYSFGYAFDNIGNRETATRNDRTATYTPNLLNQYDQRTVSGYVDVLGEAHATATVTVEVSQRSAPVAIFTGKFRWQILQTRFTFPSKWKPNSTVKTWTKPATPSPSGERGRQ